MKQIILVGCGGFIGAISRHLAGGLLLHYVSVTRFPIGTVMVNVVGCFIIGLISGLIEKGLPVTTDWRLFLIPGLLGGFTTFSSFGLETIFLFKRGQYIFAFLNVTLSVLLGLLLAWIGFKLGENLLAKSA